jgi:hypothetical protein
MGLQSIQASISSPLPAFPHVLELAQARALFFRQQRGQILGEARRDRFALTQVPGNLPLDDGNMLAVLGFAHGSTCRSLPSSVIV